MSDRESKDLARKEQRTPGSTPAKAGNTPGKVKKKNNIMDIEDQSGGDNQNTVFKPKSLAFDDYEENDKSPYDHPVYKIISMKNGEINRLDLSSLKRVCKVEGLDSLGKRDAIKRRLKEHFKIAMLKKYGLFETPAHRSFDYLVVVDFEATCEEKNLPDYPHEIIEFPAVLVDARSGLIVSKWREYVRPVINTTLSPFCQNLTGITQEIVDKASEFSTVLDNFHDWISLQSLGNKYTFLLVTDGPFDVGRFLRLSCHQINIDVPVWATRWCNIRKAFANFYRSNSSTKIKAPGLQTMLNSLDLEFEGSPHSGLDDATNIARVATRIIKDGGQLRVNERLEENLENVSPTRQAKARLQHVVPVTRKEADNWFREMRRKLEMAS